MSGLRYLAAGAAALALSVVAPIALVFVVAADQSPASTNPGALNTAALPRAGVPYIPLVEADGSLCSAISPAELAAQLDQESGFNADAVSSAGAEGPAQFLPSTWAMWGVGSPFNPARAVKAMARYDSALAAQMAPLAQTGVPVQELMLAGYNAGPAAVIADQAIPPGQPTQYVNDIEAKIATYTLELVSDVGGTGLGLRIVAEAESQLGVPYVWGGGDDQGPTNGQPGDPGGNPISNERGFDCSGLVMYAVFQASGGSLRLPHSSEIQSTLGHAVIKAQLAPGDVIGFALSGGGDFDHIGIYIGDGQMIDAPDTGSVVRLDNLDTPYWQSVPWAMRSFR